LIDLLWLLLLTALSLRESDGYVHYGKSAG
jgi:hypothetical protein